MRYQWYDDTSPLKSNSHINISTSGRNTIVYQSSIIMSFHLRILAHRARESQLYDDDEESQLHSLQGSNGLESPPFVGGRLNIGTFSSLHDIIHDGNHEDSESQQSSIETILDRYAEQATIDSGTSFRPPSIINIGQTFDYNNFQHSPIYPMISSLTPPDILSAGLCYAGFDLKRQQQNNIARKVEWFKAFYGVEPTTVAPFFVDLRNEYQDDIVFKDCLMTMNWLTLYEPYVVMSGRWKYCEEYIGPRVLEYGYKMRDVAIRKVKWVLDHNVELGRTVDCTTNPMQEMRKDPSTDWFDYKTHSCGVKYETCLAIHAPQICSIRGPFKPSIHDITVFRGGTTDKNIEDWDQEALYFKLQDGEKCIGDSGYAGEPSKVVITKDEHSSEFKEFMARAKNRQETFHWRLSAFNILGHRFRHGKSTEEKLKLHKMAFELVTGIIQYDYENGHPPFDV